jgi:4,5-DOPA dioxygenase extradiol
MNRLGFLKTLPLITSGIMLNLNKLHQATEPLAATPRMPVLFLGHGSPMNAIEENEFVAGFRKTGREIPRPNAIVCVSAHWETRGTMVTAMEQPRTIHDFGGFPRELYEVQYPAPGSPGLAAELKNTLHPVEVGMDHHWGLDHGAWSVVKHLYPEADIPVIQLSLDIRKTPQQHYELARELASLRKKGVLVIGSGNMVHNLRMVAWDKLSSSGYAFDWASEASEKMKTFILNRDHNPLIQYSQQGRAFQLSIPTPEHYLPLLYVLALQEKNETVELFNDQAVAGSLTMTSVKIS